MLRPAKILRCLRQQIWHDLMDDPVWTAYHVGQEVKHLDLNAYFDYQRLRTTHATFFNISAFVKMNGISVKVFQKNWGATLKKTWDEKGSNDKAVPLQVLFRGMNHYDLSGRSTHPLPKPSKTVPNRLQTDPNPTPQT